MSIMGRRWTLGRTVFPVQRDAHKRSPSTKGSCWPTKRNADRARYGLAGGGFRRSSGNRDRHEPLRCSLIRKWDIKVDTARGQGRGGSQDPEPCDRRIADAALIPLGLRLPRSELIPHR
jgi:hypothetical protein